MTGGLLLGMSLSTATTQFDWGNNTVGLSTLAAGVAVGILVASGVGRDDKPR